MRTPRNRMLAAAAAFTAAAAVAATLALPGAAGSAPGPRVAAPPAAGPRVAAPPAAVPDRWVVTLAGRPDVGSVARSLTAAYTGLLEHTFTRVTRGFAVRMPAAQARRLAADPRVASVQPDVVVRTLDTQTPAPWGLDRIDQRTLPLTGGYTYAGTGAGVRAYVIDTGIRTTHTDFGGRATVGADFVGDGRNGADCDGHGTHVAGILGGRTHGVAKGVSLVAVRVLDCSGAGYASDVIAGIDWVTRTAVRPAVANLSLGLAQPYAPLEVALRTSIAAGITYAVAAGNDGGDACAQSPARVPEALTVGATTRTDARADYSDAGRCVDLFAPGSEIPSAWYTGNTVVRTSSGTSMAAPHVAGAAALHLAANPGAAPAAVAAALTAAATTGVVTGAGSGSPDRLLHTGPADPTGPPPTTSPPTTPPPTAPPPTTPPPTTPPATTAPPATGYPGLPMPGRPTSTAPTSTAPTSTGTATPAPGTANETDVPIPDRGSAESAIVVGGRTGRAPGALRVAVRVVHPYRGDLGVELVAPDGRTYRIKNPSSFDGARDFTVVATVNASASPLAGRWVLRVRDAYVGDVGHLDRWALLI